MAIKPLRLTKTASGGAIAYDLLTAATTIIDGDLCVKANNTVATCGADPAVISYFAQIASTATVPGETKFLLGRVRPVDTFEMNVYHGTSTSATIADADLDGQADYGIAFQTVSGVAAWFIDLEDTSNKRVRIIGRIDSAATLYCRGEVQFLPSTLTFS